jgi:hypothetical protein
VFYGRIRPTSLSSMKNINPPSRFDEHFLLERLTKLKDRW